MELLFARPSDQIGVYLPFLFIAFIESILMTVLPALGEMIRYGFACLPAIWLPGGIATFLIGRLY